MNDETEQHETGRSAPSPVPTPAAATTPTADLLAQTQRLGGDIDAVLGGLLARLRRRFLLHGLGWIVAAIALGTLLYFVLDRALDLPVTVRILLSVGFAGYLAFGVRRRILYPMRREIAGDDIAIALERRFPELRQRLISAVQLARSAATGGAAAERGQSSAMIAKVVGQAADDIRSLPTSAILDPRRTMRVWAAGGLAVLIAAVTLAWVPGTANVFFARMFGADVNYPRRTHLFIELPQDDPEFRVTLGPDSARVVMPAGGDLPVLVRIEGVVPRDVQLVTQGGKGVAPEVSMTPRDEARYRHVFRRVQAPFTFHARGGDDPYGDRRVSVEVIEPPRVASIRASITFPAYTRLLPAEVVGGGIEAVVGSTVGLHVTATAAVATAKLLLIDSGQTAELTPESIQDDSGVGVAYTGTFQVTRSDRYQIQLVGPDSIGNPHPGTYPILALEDHAPVARLLSPVDDELNVVLPNGLLPLRMRAGDDFGIDSIVVVTVAGRGDHETRVELYRQDPARSSAEAGAEATAGAVDLEVAKLFEVAELGAAGISVGDTIVVSAQVTDNRAPDPTAPTPQTTEVPKRQVHVVGPTDLGRRIANHFRRIRDSVDKALAMQIDRRERLEQMLEGLAANADVAALGADLITVEVGQGRVLAETRRVHRELMRSFDVHLFNRVEESIHAPKVIELYERFESSTPTARSAADPDSSLPPEFYRSVSAARERGTVGAMEKTLDPILAMLAIADRLAEQLTPTALRQVESASVTSLRDDYVEALRAAGATQASIVAGLEELRGRLDEWNEFQDVITQTRAIRDKQRDLRNRTNSLQEGTK